MRLFKMMRTFRDVALLVVRMALLKGHDGAAVENIIQAATDLIAQLQAELPQPAAAPATARSRPQSVPYLRGAEQVTAAKQGDCHQADEMPFLGQRYS